MILIGLGSNLGNRESNILEAIRNLNSIPGTMVTAVSGLYETEPIGFLEQPAFLNAAISIDTTLSPQVLLKYCLSIEITMGRIRDKRWGPRVIDIDLLTYHQVCIDDVGLQLPHPRIPERRFVLIPLRDIAAYEVVFGGQTVERLLCSTKDHSLVQWYGKLKFPFKKNEYGEPHL